MAKRRPGKYDHLFPKLKKLPPQDLEYQLRVEETKKLVRRCVACSGTGKALVCDCGQDVTETDITMHASDCALQSDPEPCRYCLGTGRRKLTGQALSELYVVARADKETLERMTKEANLELEAVTQLLIASQEAGDSDWGAFGASDRAIKLTNGDSIRVQPEVFALARNKQEFREWCYTNGLRSQMELPDKPTTDLAKARLLNGESEPSGLEIYVRTRVVYTPLKTEVTSSSSEQNAVDTAEVF